MKKIIDILQSLIRPKKINNRDMRLPDSATTHIIHKDKKYVFFIYNGEAHVSKISFSMKLTKCSGRDK